MSRKLTYEWRCCAGDHGKPVEDTSRVFETREEAAEYLPFMQGDPAYDRMWIERRAVPEWEFVEEIKVAPLYER